MKDENKKKILKVVQVVYNVLSALFIAFVCVGLCLTSCDNKEVKQEVTPNTMIYESKIHKDYIQNGTGYYAFCASDLLSSTFIENVVNNWLAPSPNLQVGDESFVFSVYHDIAVGSYSLFNGYANDLGYSSMTPLSIALKIKVTFIYRQMTSSLTYYQYEFKFVADSITITYRPNLFIDYATSASNGTCYAVNSVSYSPSGDYMWITNNQYFIDYFSPVNDYDTGYAQGYQNGHDVGYDEGYSDGDDYGYMRGYTGGKMDGYDEGVSDGYTDGYIAGQHDATYDTANAFTLIGSAFSSMASILSIELFPNFTLGVLVFIPVILAIVFVVVKMIKG